MKVFKKAQITNDKFIDQFIREMKIQSYLNHPNVIRLYGYFDDAANIYVLIELACDGTLFKFLEDRQNQEPQS
jgi:serine/threonine protein kinase